MATRFNYAVTIHFNLSLPPISLGGSPNETGESPVPPLPENVNYAVKSSFLLSFLESVSEVSAKLEGARTAERRFDDVVKDAEQVAVLVLVY
jgi:hypothetical protein